MPTSPPTQSPAALPTQRLAPPATKPPARRPASAPALSGDVLTRLLQSLGSSSVTVVERNGAASVVTVPPHSVTPPNAPEPSAVGACPSSQSTSDFEGPRHRLTRARSQASSPFGTHSGAFHAVRSINGCSAVRATVSIPCGARHFVTGPGFDETTQRPGTVDLETGYIYVGGWGAGPSGAAADAGLQKSPTQAPRDDYAMYWKFANNKPLEATQRFPCGGPAVTLELYPASDGLLVFTATGVDESGTRVRLTIVQKTRPSDGWIPSGGSATNGVILKRVVSIAQPQSWSDPATMPNRFSDGSYFGIANRASPEPLIVWFTCEIGRVTPPSIFPRYEPWTAAQTWHPPAGTYVDWPPAAVHLVRNVAGECDRAGIYLDPKL